jgi:hypothetical protein
MTLASLTKTLFIMKKTLLLLVTILVTGAINAQTVFNDGTFTYTTIDSAPGTCEVKGWVVLPSANVDVVIPSTVMNGVDSYTVTTIGLGAFSCNTASNKGSGFTDNTYIQTVSLPASVTIFKAHAFRDNPNLTAINLENIIDSGSNTFANCTKLETIGTLSSLVTIGSYTFSQCSKLTSIVIPVAITIGDGAISNANVGTGGISTIEIPSTVTTIGSIFLGRLGSLTSVTVNWSDPALVTVNATNFFRDLTQANITLNVPYGTASLYGASTSVWKGLNIVEQPSLGIHNIEQELGAAIYPNPTDGNLTLKMNTASNVDVTVYDLNGRALLNKKVNDTQSEINISNQPSGVYLLKVKADNGEFSKRIIKQ